MMTSWKEKLPEALKIYLQEQTGRRIQRNQDAFQTMSQLSTKQKQGLWKRVGQILKTEQNKARDYYHNTWVKQFYDEPTADMLACIKGIAQLGLDHDEIMARFTAMHPQLNFYPRQLSQIIRMVLARLQGGFSVKAEQCVVLQDIFRMSHVE